MSLWVLILLCVVQGLTEFLPVSSSGHLLFVEQLFGIKDNLLLINLFLHLSTLLAVVVVYRKVLWGLLKKPFQPLTFKLMLSTAVTVVFAMLYKLLHLDGVVVKFYGVCFLVTAGLLFLAYKFQENSAVVKTGELSYKNAFLVGAVQGLAVLPGISRSGSTISAMILSGNDETQSAEYSFLLSIPIIVGGFIVELLEAGNWTVVFGGVSWWWCLIAFVLTFGVAILSLKLTVKFLKEKKFKWFSIYLLIVGLVVSIFNWFVW